MPLDSRAPRRVGRQGHRLAGRPQRIPGSWSAHPVPDEQLVDAATRQITDPPPLFFFFFYQCRAAGGLYRPTSLRLSSSRRRLFDGVTGKAPDKRSAARAARLTGKEPATAKPPDVDRGFLSDSGCRSARIRARSA